MVNSFYSELLKEGKLYYAATKRDTYIEKYDGHASIDCVDMKLQVDPMMDHPLDGDKEITDLTQPYSAFGGQDILLAVDGKIDAYVEAISFSTASKEHAERISRNGSNFFYDYDMAADRPTSIAIISAQMHPGFHIPTNPKLIAMAYTNEYGAMMYTGFKDVMKLTSATGSSLDEIANSEKTYYAAAPITDDGLPIKLPEKFIEASGNDLMAFLKKLQESGNTSYREVIDNMATSQIPVDGMYTRCMLAALSQVCGIPFN